MLVASPSLLGADGRPGRSLVDVDPLSRANRDVFLAYGETLIPEYLESRAKDPRYYAGWISDLASIKHMINSKPKDLLRNPKLLESMITDFHDLVDLTYNAMERDYNRAVTSVRTMGEFATAREFSESYLESRRCKTVYYDALVDQGIRKLMEIEIIQPDKTEGLFEVEWNGKKGQLWYRSIRGSYQVIPISPDSKRFYQTFFNESHDSLQPSLIFSEGRLITNSGFVLRSLPGRDDYIRLQRFYGADAPEDKRFTVFTKALYLPKDRPMAQLLREFMGEESPMFLALPQTRREVLALENQVLRMLIEDLSTDVSEDLDPMRALGGGVGSSALVHSETASKSIVSALDPHSESTIEPDNLESLRAQLAENEADLASAIAEEAEEADLSEVLPAGSEEASSASSVRKVKVKTRGKPDKRKVARASSTPAGRDASSSISESFKELRIKERDFLNEIGHSSVRFDALAHLLVKVYKLKPVSSVSTTTRGSHLTFHDSLGALTVARPHGTDDVHPGIARNAIRRAFACLYKTIQTTAKE
jgi:hypothetical protein